MNINYSAGDPLASPVIKEIVAEQIQIGASCYIPGHIMRGVRFGLRQDYMSDGWIASLAGSLSAVLVKEHVEDGGTEETEEMLPSDIHWVPARPVDHLIEFLRAYLPTKIGDWLFLRFYEERTLPVEKCILKQVTKKIIHKHYHVIPRHLDQMGEQNYYRYAAWLEDYYNGSSEEWGDLVKLRDMVLDASQMDYNSRKDDIYARYSNLSNWIQRISLTARDMKFKAESDRARGK